MSAEHEHGTEDCRELFARLSEFLDGDLDPALCTELEGHLADCAPCEAFLDSLRRTVRLVGSLEPEPLPATIRAQVREAYARLRQQRGD